jgi:SprT protein
MPLFKQLELELTIRSDSVSVAGATKVAGQALRLPIKITAHGPVGLEPKTGRDRGLESLAIDLLRAHGARRIASQLRVEWNRRLKSCAGRADYRSKLISLNPLLHAHGDDEVRRTLLHELAHLLAQFRAGRRRIAPHGLEWRRACHDLGIGDEKRCHNLPLPVNRRARRFLYRCPHCRRDFPRTRRIRRSVACLACCRAHSRGNFDPRFRLRLVA